MPPTLSCTSVIFRDSSERISSNCFCVSVRAPSRAEEICVTTMSVWTAPAATWLKICSFSAIFCLISTTCWAMASKPVLIV